MPITSSAKKALRQNKTRKTHNLVKKEAYKKLVTKYRKAIAAKAHEEAGSLLSLVFKALDKAAKTKVIEKNKASRLKSRLAKMLKK